MICPIFSQVFSREDYMEDDQMHTVIKVTNSKLNVCTHWNLAKFEEKLMQMKDLYQVLVYLIMLIVLAHLSFILHKDTIGIYMYTGISV